MDRPFLDRFDKVEAMLAELVRQRTVKDWYSTDEVANILGKAKFTVREWCRHGRVHCRKKLTGRGKSQSWVISRDELLRIQREGLLPLETVSTKIEWPVKSGEHVMPLSAEDRKHLESLEGKLQIVRDRTRSVARDYRSGLHLWGEGGIGKSYSVLSELDMLKADYVLNNSRLTGRALFDLLLEYPDQIHVIEDCEPLFADRNACGVLRSALWGQSNTQHGQERLVTWRTFNQQLSVCFEGGIILIGNRKLDNFPELRAIQSRIPTLQLTATNLELAALMRSVSEDGFRVLVPKHNLKSMTPTQCSEVCEFLISEIHSLARNLDMRLLVNSFRDYIQPEDGEAQTHWKDLVRSELKQQTTMPESRHDRLARKREIALEIAGMTELSATEKERLFEEKTGTSGRGYRRRLQEARA